MTEETWFDVKKDMRENPDKYDFGDLPKSSKLTPAQRAQMERMRPDWMKRRLTKTPTN